MIQMFKFFGILIISSYLFFKPIEMLMQGLGYPPDSNASWSVQTVSALVAFFMYFYFKNRKEGKEYEREIEKRLRTEREIREKLDKEYSSKNKKQ